MMARILTVFGTRPEAIKMAPVVRALKRHNEIEVTVCVTAQHREMLDQVLELFGIVPDHDLGLMRSGQDLFDLTTRILLGMRKILGIAEPDLVVVQGDTTTCMAAALAAFYKQVPIAHVEAGLRSGRLDAPFPEEANRCIVSRMTALHFAPTNQARQNLIGEGISPAAIFVTGNTVIDALQITQRRLRDYPDRYWAKRFGGELYSALCSNERRFILLTGHRRESFGQGIRAVCHTIADLARAHRDWLFVYSVHLNPEVQIPVRSLLATIANVYLIEPLDYLSFVWLMNRADLLLTDSGGIQEEAPALHKPVLVTREVTERSEAVEAGTVKLVGCDPTRIRYEVERVMQVREVYLAMARAKNPYGDGTAGARIAEEVRRWAQRKRALVDSPGDAGFLS